METHVPGRSDSGDVRTHDANCSTVSFVDVKVHDTTEAAEYPLHGDESTKENAKGSTLATAVRDRS